MEIAFDNKEADRMVLGGDLTPSLVLGEAGLGPISSVAKGINMPRYGYNPGFNESVAAGGATVGALGLFGGIFSGAKKKGLKGGIIGGLIGATAGSAVGGSIGGGSAVAGAVSYARNNQQLLSQSPFSNSSLATAESLNASGDIVLGMHNMRRG